MANKLITTDELTGVRVIGGKKGTKRIGKVRRFVFHPKEKRVVGFVVKRPDLLWMFRRKDLFVAVSGYEIEDGRIVVSNDPAATNRAACKALGVDWDACVLWVGLPVMTEDGDALGVVGSVTFDRKTGVVDSVTTDSGAACGWERLSTSWSASRRVAIRRRPTISPYTGCSTTISSTQAPASATA